MSDWGQKIAPGVYSIGQSMGRRVHAFLLADGAGLPLVADAERLLVGIGRRRVQDLKQIACAHRWEADIIAAERKAQRLVVWIGQMTSSWLIAKTTRITVCVVRTAGTWRPRRVSRPRHGG
jgi:hypothetical protein